MINIPWLEPGQALPSPEYALDEPNGLLAAGEELSVERLLEAYPAGIFPWFEQGQPVLWWSPNPRSVVFPGKVHESRSLRKLRLKKHFRISFDEAFTDVMVACAQPRDYTDDTWITDSMVAVYSELHRQGIAHSVEVWQDDVLVGGLYGIALGKVFFGESMFSLVSNASKLAFVELERNLLDWGFELIDCQLESEHLNSLGAQNIDRRDFTARLKGLIADESSSWAMGEGA